MTRFKALVQVLTAADWDDAVTGFNRLLAIYVLLCMQSLVELRTFL